MLATSNTSNRNAWKQKSSARNRVLSSTSPRACHACCNSRTSCYYCYICPTNTSIRYYVVQPAAALHTCSGKAERACITHTRSCGGICSTSNNSAICSSTGGFALAAQRACMQTSHTRLEAEHGARCEIQTLGQHVAHCTDCRMQDQSRRPTVFQHGRSMQHAAAHSVPTAKH